MNCDRETLPPNADRALNLLLQRELIEKVNDGYCFQVELIRLWFANVDQANLK
jgi:hypothetical protein